MLVKFNKPFNVLSQFSDKTEKSADRGNLSDFISIPNIYPVGRLDKDSEGLMPKQSDLDLLRAGLKLRDGITRPAEAKIIEPPLLWDRVPPIRVRKTVPDSWLEIIISEGRNRQVRRMTAAIGYPTLRLIRIKIGDYDLKNLMPGDFENIP